MEFLKKYWHFIVVSVVVAAVLFNILGGKDKKKDKAENNNTYHAVQGGGDDMGNKIASMAEELGYEPNDYITLGQYIGIEYTPGDIEVSDEQLQEAIDEDVKSYRKVERSAEEGDEVNISFEAFVDDKKEENLCLDDYDMIIGDQDLDATIDEKTIGKKAGDKFTVKIVNPYYFPMDEEKSYEAKEVRFEITVNEVLEEYFEELTDEWVKENYSEEGFTTVDEYKKSLIEQLAEANKEDEELDMKTTIWEKVVENATMNGYPDILYDNIVAIDEANLKYEAEELWGMTLQDYIKENEIDVEEMYLEDVKAELVMWSIARKESLLVSDKEVEQGFQELYEEYGYDSAENMKKEYDAYEVERALVEDKVITFVCDNANILE